MSKVEAVSKKIALSAKGSMQAIEEISEKQAVSKRIRTRLLG
jgi:hypothetical protein